MLGLKIWIKKFKSRRKIHILNLKISYSSDSVKVQKLVVTLARECGLDLIRYYEKYFEYRDYRGVFRCTQSEKMEFLNKLLDYSDLIEEVDFI